MAVGRYSDSTLPSVFGEGHSSDCSDLAVSKVLMSASSRVSALPPNGDWPIQNLSTPHHQLKL